MKLLSIVVPVYNTFQYLPRCLDSILLEDTLQSIEVIAVNDGSTDGSLHLLQEYAQKYSGSVVVVDKENGGHGSTINAGLRIASGKYFRVLDSDDWLDSSAFVSFINELSSCNEDLVVTPYTMEYVYNGQSASFDYHWLNHNCTHSMEEIHYSYKDMYFAIPSSTYKTEVLRQSGLQLYEKCYYVDMQFITAPIPLVKTVRVLDDSLYRYYIGRPDQSMSTEKLMRNYPQHMRVTRWLIDFVAELPETTPENIRSYLNDIAALMYYTNADILNKLPSRKTAYNELKKIDLYLQQKAPDLFALTTKNTVYSRFINKCRQYAFINVFFPKTFMR